ncbi:lytic transglycosylase domain-containing protein [Diaphorobacter sp. HDW4A]|nr:lytic transglycosylase domain-containing protein [Diaphorobacter sp. HDW4A]
MDSPWWPYSADAARRIEPVITDKVIRRNAEPQVLAKAAPPKAYDEAARASNVDSWVLYGIALQESNMKLGEHTLPYPWTLCVAGSAKRYGGYEQTVQALRSFVNERGIRNVDCGVMQVNWRWHNDKLQSFERALQPLANLAVGAQILREHYERSGSWMRAAALYHTGSDADGATVARGQRYASGVFRRLGRMGLKVDELQASTGWRRYAV